MLAQEFPCISHREAPWSRKADYPSKSVSLQASNAEYMVDKKTKIICTIADNRCDVDFIRQLYENGMNVVRINSAHATIEGAQIGATYMEMKWV